MWMRKNIKIPRKEVLESNVKIQVSEEKLEGTATFLRVERQVDRVQEKQIDRQKSN